MASLLLKHLASSLTRTAGQMSRLTLSGEGAYRCLCTLTCGPRSLLTARINSIQSLPSAFSAQCGPSLFGPCQHLPSIQPSVGMKTKSALKKRCKDCFFVRRRGRLFVFCKTNPRHKQRQG